MFLKLLERIHLSKYKLKILQLQACFCKRNKWMNNKNISDNKPIKSVAHIIFSRLFIHPLNHVHFNVYFRSLSELDSLRLTGEAGDKIRQVTERATLFRITSNAMINVSQNIKSQA